MNFEPDTLENLKSERTMQRSFVFWLLGFILLLGIDQLSKLIVFDYNAILPFSVFDWLVLFKNDQFAFSLPVPIGIMYAIYAIVIGAIIWHLRKTYRSLNSTTSLAWIFILAGGLSNIVERLFIGYVRDFIPVPNGGIINVADIYIILGVLMLLIIELRKNRAKK
jgi:signal peptidase II